MQTAIRWLVNILVRLTLKVILRGWVPIKLQRAGVWFFAHSNLAPRGMQYSAIHLGTVRAERVTCGVNSGRVVIYLHGGGYCVASPFSHRALAARIAQAAEATCFVPDYRLAPEYPFPAALDDAVEAYRALLQQGLKPAQIAIGGDSAGGGLSISTALAIRDAGLPLPAALVLMSPWTDLTLSGESGRTNGLRDAMLTFSVAELWSRLYTGTHPANHPGCSPLFADLRGLPPLLIQVGSEEILLDDSRRFAARAEEAGVGTTLHLYERMWHIFPAHAPLLQESNAALAEIGAFLRSELRV